MGTSRHDAPSLRCSLLSAPRPGPQASRRTAGTGSDGIPSIGVVRVQRTLQLVPVTTQLTDIRTDSERDKGLRVSSHIAIGLLPDRIEGTDGGLEPVPFDRLEVLH